LNKQVQTADKEWFFSLWVGRGLRSWNWTDSLEVLDDGEMD